MSNTNPSVREVERAYRSTMARTWSTLAVVLASMLAINIYSYFTIQRMNSMTTTMSMAALNVKVKTLEANLFFREIASGVSNRDMNAVWRVIEDAKSQAAELERGGGGQALSQRLDAFKKILLQCYEAKNRGADNNTAIKLRSNYNNAFQQVLSSANDVERSIRQTVADKMDTFKKLYMALLVNIVVLFLFIVYTFFKYSRQRLAVEKQLASAKDSLDLVINSTRSIIIAVDANLTVLEWNAAAERHTRLPADQALKSNLLEIFPALSPFKSTIEKVYHSKHPEEQYRQKVELNGEELFFDISMNHSEGMDGVVLQIDDVTEREKREEQLRQSQKMSVAASLIKGLAHSFNNALGAIIGTVSTMKYAVENQRPIDDIQNDMEVIESSAEKAEVMVSQLLSLSEDVVPAFKPVDLNPVIRHLMRICENTLDKRIELQAELYADPAIVMADPKQLGQVILNLCDNAANAMTCEDYKEGIRELTVSLDRVEIDDEFREKQPLATKDTYWAVAIGDTGIGMDMQTVERMFDPFFSTKPNATGLGLAIVSDIVTQHGGFIDVRSSAGDGTIVTIYLPAHVEEKPATTPEPKDQEKSATPVAAEEGIVMVVDDEAVMRRITSNILTELGYKVVTAEDGLEAVEIFREKHDTIMLTIMDLSMPRMSGPDAYMAMKEIDPNPKVLLISGFNDDRISAALKMGMRGFVKKPFSMDDLARKVSEIISS